MDDPAIQPIVVRGCRIALRRAGSGPPMLILHGAADADTWLACLTELAADHDVILPEHPGFGASDTPDWLDTIADLANFYLEFLDQLRHRLLLRRPAQRTAPWWRDGSR